jgi:putative IMPACT (imprinted ancient) family translation regulator
VFNVRIISKPIKTFTMAIETKFFSRELNYNLKEYLDTTCNTVNLTLLAEYYIDTHKTKIDSENEVFEAVIDWYNTWPNRNNFKKVCSLFN